MAELITKLKCLTAFKFVVAYIVGLLFLASILYGNELNVLLDVAKQLVTVEVGHPELPGRGDN